MSSLPAPPRIACQVVQGCPRAWLVVEVKDKGRVVAYLNTCRKHATVAIDHMLTVGPKPEVRIAR